MADVFVQTYDKEEAFVKQFITKIRQHKAYANSLIVGIIESDLNVIDTSRFASYFKRSPPVYILSHKREGREAPGIRSDHENKLRYSRDLITFLESRSICFAQDMFAVTADNTNASKTSMMAKAKEQLRVFALVEELPTRPGFQNKKFTTTGKHRGMPDDIAMAIQMCVHFSLVTVLEPGFSRMLASGNRRLVGT